MRLRGGCGEVEREVAPDAFWDCCSLFSLKKRRAGSAGEDICGATLALAQSPAATRCTHRGCTRVWCVYMRDRASAPSLDPQSLQLLLDYPLFDPIPSSLQPMSVSVNNPQRIRHVINSSRRGLSTSPESVTKVKESTRQLCATSSCRRDKRCYTQRPTCRGTENHEARIPCRGGRRRQSAANGISMNPVGIVRRCSSRGIGRRLARVSRIGREAFAQTTHASAARRPLLARSPSGG